MKPTIAPFVHRLKTLTPLTPGDIDALIALASPPRLFGKERAIVEEGARPARLHILIDGWAARVKVLADGRRFFSTVLVPGDICDIDGMLVRAYDYGVVALTPCTVVAIPHVALLALCDHAPAIARALTWFGFVDNAMLVEVATSLARRNAIQRLAYLLCELRLRLAAVGMGRPDGFTLPLSQENMGEALGTTGVHMNRSVKALRLEGLASISGRAVAIPDEGRLRRLAGFSPAYLHLEGMRK